MQIEKEAEYRIMSTAKKGVSGGIVAAVALAIISCFHGLTPEQNQAGVVISVAALEALRNLLKKKLPGIFFWL